MHKPSNWVPYKIDSEASYSNGTDIPDILGGAVPVIRCYKWIITIFKGVVYGYIMLYVYRGV